MRTTSFRDFVAAGLCATLPKHISLFLIVFCTTLASFACPLVPPNYNSNAMTTTCNSFTVTGINASGAFGYEILVSENSDMSSPEPSISFGGSSVTVPNLDIGKMYYFIIRSLRSTCTPNVSAWTDTNQVKLDSNFVLSMHNITCNSASIWWTPWSGGSVARYSIKNVNTGGTFTSPHTGTNPQAVPLSGLSPNTNYTFEVTVDSPASSCNLTSSISFTTAPLLSPPDSTGISDSNVTCVSFRASWSTVAGATGYYIEVSTDPVFGSHVPGYNWLYIPYGHTSYLDVTGLSASTKYYYRVRSANQCISNGSVSATVTTLPPLSPPDMTGISASNVTCSSFRAHWNTVAGASGYFLEVITPSGYHPSYNWLYVPNGATSYQDVDIDIDPSTTYYYSIRTANECISGPSTYIMVVTPSCKKGNAGTQSTGIFDRPAKGQAAAANIRFMPNPTNGTVQFSCESVGAFNYQLIDIQGRLLKVSRIQNGDIINLEEYSAGIYMVKMFDEHGAFINTTKLVKN